MDELKSAYALALQTEDEGHKLYAEAAQKATHPLGKDILSFLAGEERKHSIVIKKIMDKIAAGEKFSMTDFDLDASAGKTIFSEAIAKPEARIPGKADELEALKAGIRFENEGIAFFNNAAKKTENPEAKRFFETLAREERSHKALLLSSIEYLENPETWFESQGPIILDGV